MGLFDELDRACSTHSTRSSANEDRDDTILRPPFGYPGGKSRSVKHILPLLPMRDVYVEPFGGSAAVLIARAPVKLEVFNDRFAGVVAFYQCLRDERLYKELIDFLDMVLHSREEFITFQATWEDFTNPVQRAGMWYALTQYSFGSMGRNWGRAVTPKGIMAGKVARKLELFPRLHERFKRVQVENQDWSQCIRDYDSPETVFYLDPPYVDAHQGAHKHTMTHSEHVALLNCVFNSKGFFAVSGYSNDLYEMQNWDARYEWESFVSLDSKAFTEGNRKQHLEGVTERVHAQEVLWIKESC